MSRSPEIRLNPDRSDNQKRPNVTRRTFLIGAAIAGVGFLAKETLFNKGESNPPETELNEAQIEISKLVEEIEKTYGIVVSFPGDPNFLKEYEASKLLGQQVQDEQSTTIKPLTPESYLSLLHLIKQELEKWRGHLSEWGNWRPARQGKDMDRPKSYMYVVKELGNHNISHFVYRYQMPYTRLQRAGEPDTTAPGGITSGKKVEEGHEQEVPGYAETNIIVVTAGQDPEATAEKIHTSIAELKLMRHGSEITGSSLRTDIVGMKPEDKKLAAEVGHALADPHLKEPSKKHALERLLNQ